MANADRVRMALKAESTYGTNPGGAGAEILRITSDSLALTTDTAESSEIRSDRMNNYLARTQNRVSGDINFEFSYGSFDTLLAAGLFSAGFGSQIVVDPGSTSTTTGAIGTQKITASNALSGQIGSDIIAINSSASNNKIFKIRPESSNTSTVKFLEGNTLASETAAMKIVEGSPLVNGVTQTSFSIERTYSDLSGTGSNVLYTGMVVDGFNMNFETDSVVSGSFSFMGQDACSHSSDQFGGYTAAAENDIMNTTDEIQAVSNDGVPFSCRSFSFSVANNLRTRENMGTLGPVSIGAGTTAISGSFTAYYENADLLDKFLNFSKTNLFLVVQDSSNQAYAFDFPSVRFTSGTRVAGGQNQDIMAEINFTAFRDAQEDIMMRVSRFTDTSATS